MSASRHGWLATTVFLVTIALAPVLELSNGSWPGRGETFSASAFRRGDLAARIQTVLARKSVVAKTLRPYYDEALFETLGAVTPGVVIGEGRWLFLAGTVPGYASPADRARIEDVARLAAKLHEWLAARGARLLVVPIPSKAALYGSKLPHPRVESFGDTLATLRGAGLWVVDLRRALEPKQADTFLPNDEHWSSNGARRAADAIVSDLRDARPEEIPGADGSGRLVQDRPKLHRGDLLGMLAFRPGGRLESSFLVSERVWRGVDAAGAELRIETPEPTVLTGTSFSYVGHLGSLLTVLLSQRVEERTTAGLGPAASTAALVGQIAQGRRAPPSLVIWEIPERHLYDERLPGRLHDLLAGAPLPHWSVEETQE